MEIIDSILSVAYLKVGIISIVFLLFAFWAIEVIRKLRVKFQAALQRKADLEHVKKLRKQYKRDISAFIKSYQNDLSTKLEENEVKNGLFVFWDDADSILKKFKDGTPHINKLPNKDERVALHGFYEEAKSLIDGIIYNNQLLEKYQQLRSKMKTSRATSAELKEAKNLTHQMPLIGVQLRQQHHELLASLKAVKAYF